MNKTLFYQFLNPKILSFVNPFLYYAQTKSNIPTSNSCAAKFTARKELEWR